MNSRQFAHGVVLYTSAYLQDFIALCKYIAHYTFCIQECLLSLKKNFIYSHFALNKSRESSY